MSNSFAAPCTIAHQAPLSLGFPRQEYWSGLPFPSPGDLPDPRIEPGSPALQADSVPSKPPGKPLGFSARDSKLGGGHSNQGLHLNRPEPPRQGTRSLLHPWASPFSPPQTDALQQLQKDSEAIRIHYAHYFDLSLVNNSVEETLKTLQEAFDQACRSPQWVPVSWVY